MKLCQSETNLRSSKVIDSLKANRSLQLQTKMIFNSKYIPSKFNLNKQTKSFKMLKQRKKEFTKLFNLSRIKFLKKAKINLS